MIWLSDLAGVLTAVGLLICAAAWLVHGMPRTDTDLAYCIALHACTLFAGGIWLVGKSEAA